MSRSVSLGFFSFSIPAIRKDSSSAKRDNTLYMACCVAGKGAVQLRWVTCRSLFGRARCISGDELKSTVHWPAVSRPTAPALWIQLPRHASPLDCPSGRQTPSPSGPTTSTVRREDVSDASRSDLTEAAAFIKQQPALLAHPVPLPMLHPPLVSSRPFASRPPCRTRNEARRGD